MSNSLSERSQTVRPAAVATRSALLRCVAVADTAAYNPVIPAPIRAVAVTRAAASMPVLERIAGLTARM